MVIIFSKIEGRKTGIEVKIKLFSVPSLGITKSSKLFGIPKNKFNLKPSLVIGEDLFGIEVNIGRKQQDIACFIWVMRIDEQSEAKFALQ